MYWFGKKSFSRACEESRQVPIPVGKPCLHCEEPITIDDFGYITPVVEESGVRLVPYHYACFLRGTIGSLAHQEHRCSCYVSGSDEGDPPGMTKRQAAEAAVHFWETRQKMMKRLRSCEP